VAILALCVLGCELALSVHEVGGSNADASVQEVDGSNADALDGGQTDLIDNMEDQTGHILSRGNRVGGWFTFDDGTGGSISPAAGGPFTPSAIAPPRDTSNFAAHLQAQGFTNWGAAMGFNLNQSGGGRAMPYDASAYTGFQFWARIGPDSTTTVRMSVPDGNTINDGSDSYAIDLDLTTSWKSHTVAFSQLARPSGISSGGLDASRVYGINFIVDLGKNTMADVWIDDISFIRR
jgi:hypothetical protein